MKPQIKDMTDNLKVKFAAFSAKMAESGIPFILTCVLRTPDEQEAFYAQGRLSLDEVNKLRLKAGMYLLKDDTENFIVTKTKQSRHFPDESGKSRAFDIAILNSAQKPTWDCKWDGNKDNIPDYLQAAKIGLTIGLNPGGLWKNFQDWPHFEEIQK